MGLKKAIKSIHFQYLTGIKNSNIFLLIMTCVFMNNPELLFSQSTDNNTSNKQLKILKAKGTINLDGLLNEQDWHEADKASEFIQHFPSDTDLAISKTEVSMTYDDKNIYLAAKCQDQ